MYMCMYMYIYIYIYTYIYIYIYIYVYIAATPASPALLHRGTGYERKHCEHVCTRGVTQHSGPAWLPRSSETALPPWWTGFAPWEFELHHRGYRLSARAIRGYVPRLHHRGYSNFRTCRATSLIRNSPAPRTTVGPQA